jgi:hypothetical protein
LIEVCEQRISSGANSVRAALVLAVLGMAAVWVTVLSGIVAAYLA